ncbi:MAG: GNAT family N-acetyltransferase [Chloroflexi bacterium]|jgi:L-amino acid N-acyltransferase YncA|nr:GNAT family N-acetyltransferase [Chloroflexota bacterium]
MEKSAYLDFRLEGLAKARIGEIDALHQLLREGRGLGFWRKTYLKLVGKRVCAVIFNHDEQMVGFNYYYFRESEVKDRIIHHAFIGILPEERGKGLATALQTYAIDRLSKNKLTGISGNVKKTNTTSAKMLANVGFVLTDDPDDTTNQKIYYRF